MKKLIVLFLILGILLSSLVYAGTCSGWVTIPTSVSSSSVQRTSNSITLQDINPQCQDIKLDPPEENPDPARGCTTKELTQVGYGLVIRLLCNEGWHKTGDSATPDEEKAWKITITCEKDETPPPPIPEFSTYGIIAGIVVIGLIAWYIYKKKK
ncbi:hypothetical protein KY331_06080 [Candidatus Woesearchaeota archaeon]|nr:hypothetical protein [Candidatus Woesearchaeota archaeon]